MYGMQPGIKMFTENVDFVYKIIFLSIFAIIAFTIFGLLTVKVSAKMLNIRQESVWVIVSIFCIVGSYAISNSFFDVIIMFAGGLIGFFAKRHNFPIGPFILGMILSTMVESNLRRALVISHGSFSIFFTRPITLVIFFLILLTFAWSPIRSAIKNRKMQKASAN
jgi:putative tricarboxylic transport membrane protein